MESPLACLSYSGLLAGPDHLGLFPCGAGVAIAKLEDVARVDPLAGAPCSVMGLNSLSRGPGISLAAILFWAAAFSSTF